MFFHVAQEVYFRDFPILRSLLQTNHAVILSFFFVVLASAIATIVVLAFGATTGRIEFQALGVKLRGPSGPIALWCVTFLVIIVGLVASRYAP